MNYYNLYGKSKYVLTDKGIMPAKKGRKEFRVLDMQKALREAKYMCQYGKCKHPKLVKSKHKRFGYVVEFDHWNSKPWDNRYENIKVLCPTCHSRLTVIGKRKRHGAFGQVYYETIKRPKERLSGKKRKVSKKGKRGKKKARAYYPFGLGSLKMKREW